MMTYARATAPVGQNPSGAVDSTRKILAACTSYE